MKLLNVASVAACLFALSLAACSKITQKPADAGLASANEPAPSVAANKVTSCLGTEPFWSLKIEKDKIVLEGLDSALNMSMRNQGAKTALGSTSEYVALYQGRAVGDTERYMNVIIQRGQCSDRMSDNIYPFKVSVLSGSALLTGCCR